MHADFAGVAAVVGLLERAGVDALPIKGCAFSALVRDDPSFRSSHDIDLLIRACDREGAVAALAPHGFRARPRPSGLIREVHLVHPRHAWIDLHCSPAEASMSLPLDFDRL